MKVKDNIENDKNIEFKSEMVIRCRDYDDTPYHYFFIKKVDINFYTITNLKDDDMDATSRNDSHLFKSDELIKELKDYWQHIQEVDAELSVKAVLNTWK